MGIQTPKTPLLPGMKKKERNKKRVLVNSLYSTKLQKKNTFGTMVLRPSVRLASTYKLP
jgi:hypothetical protein